MWLVIGYGSPLHSDDRLGWVVADQLEAALDPAIVEIAACQQLTPEWIEPISRAAGVIFVDANAELTPGQIACAALSPPHETTHAITRVHFTHHITPQIILQP